MRTVRPSSLLPILVAGLWFAAGRVCVAQQEVKFPEKSPLVSFTIPDGWNVLKERGDDFPTRKFQRNATVKFEVTLLRETYSDADFKQKLPSLAKAHSMATAVDAKLPGTESGPVTNRPLGDKIQAVCYEAKFIMMDTPCQVVVFGFTVDGKSMLAICSAWEPPNQDSAADFEKIRNSIKPLK